MATNLWEPNAEIGAMSGSRSSLGRHTPIGIGNIGTQFRWRGHWDNLGMGNRTPTRIGLPHRVCGPLGLRHLLAEGTEMRKTTLLKVLLAGIASIGLMSIPQMALAQHGGGSHGGGGSGSHGGGGFSGGSHGGGSLGGGGGFRGGGFDGYHGSAGSYGGFRGGGRTGSMYGNGSRAGSMAGESARNYSSERSPSRYARADTSPGWHSLGGSNRGAATGRSGSMTAMNRPGGSAHAMHAAISDGQWHSFSGARGSIGTATNAHFGGNGEFTHFGGGWRGGGWGGGWGWGGRGWGGYGFGWGCWACGWGLGFGWGIGWDPFWAVYPYPYWDNLSWGDPYGYFAPPYYLYPYPA